MDKIRILQVIGSSGIGGAEKVFYSLLKYLDKDKFEIYIACPANGLMFSDFRKYTKEIKAFNFKNWFFNLNTIFLLKAYMEQKRIDVVHTHLYSADFMGIIAATLARIPYKIVTIHGHNFSKTGQFDLRSLKNFFCSFVYRVIYIFSDVIITISQALKQDLIKRPGIKPKEDKVKVIYDGIDLEETSKYSQIVNRKIENIAVNNDCALVGIIANFDRVKGHRILLKAIPKIVKELENVKFLFAGEGEERNHSEQMAKKLNVEDNVIFMGICQNILGVVKLCDLIVLPSLTEGLSLAILEAMALAKPVVATSVGGIPEVVENGKTGLLVPSQNPKKLAEAILYLLKNKELALEMGRKGRMRVQEFFSLKNMVEETERVYLGLDKEKISI